MPTTESPQLELSGFRSKAAAYKRNPCKSSDEPGHGPVCPLVPGTIRIELRQSKCLAHILDGPLALARCDCESGSHLERRKKRRLILNDAID
jgi:hypothetical protein